MLALRYLDLNFEQGHYLDFKSMKILGDGLKPLSNMRTLRINLMENVIKDAGLQSLCESIQGLTKLKHLYLNCGCCIVTSESAVYLKEALSKLVWLQELTLNMTGDDNAFEDKGFTAIAEGLKSCVNMESLSLNFSWGENKITDEGLINLANVIVNLPLRNVELSLSRNLITGVGLKALSESIKKITKIEALKLNFLYTGVDEESARELVLMSSQLPNLSSLLLYLPKPSEATEVNMLSIVKKMKWLRYLKMELVASETADKDSRVIEFKRSLCKDPFKHGFK